MTAPTTVEQEHSDPTEVDDRARRRAEWRLTWVIAVVVAAISFVFGWIISVNEPWKGGVQGIINSLLISVPVSRIELGGRRWPLLRAIRHWPFYAVVMAKSAIYIALIVAATLSIPGAILLESTLSFLGFGIQPPTASWGNMLNRAWEQMRASGAWWIGFFPGLMIALTVLSFNFVGDGLRDALDPRSRSE